MLQLQQFDPQREFKPNNDYKIFESIKQQNSPKLSEERINQEGPSLQSRLFNKTTYNNSAASNKFQEQLPIEPVNEIEESGRATKGIKFGTTSSFHRKNMKAESEISGFPFLNLKNKQNNSFNHQSKDIKKGKVNLKGKDSMRQTYLKNVFKPESSMAEILKIYHKEVQTIYNRNFKNLKQLPYTKKNTDFQDQYLIEKKIVNNENNEKSDLNLNLNNNLLRCGKSKSEYEKRIQNPIDTSQTKNITYEKVLISKLNNSVKNIETTENYSNLIDDKIYQRESQTGKNPRARKNQNIEKSTKFVKIKNAENIINNGNISSNIEEDSNIYNDVKAFYSYKQKLANQSLEKQKKGNEQSQNIKSNQITNSPNKKFCFTNQPFLCINQQLSPLKHLLRCNINSGNNSLLVKRVFLAKYQNWMICDSLNNNFNFKWEMWSKNINFFSLGFSQRQCVNHFEGHKSLTTKDNLFTNLSQFCESIHLNVFDYVPLTFSFDTSNRNYSNYLNDFLKVFKLMNDVICASSNNPINFINKYINELSFHKYYSFTKLKMSDTQLDKYNTWILKPTGFNRGRGVSVFDNPFTLKKLIKIMCGGKEEMIYKPYLDHELLRFACKRKEILKNAVKSKKFVIQKYIEKPLLINGRKFDIRMWALLDHEMNVYLFKEGYLRTSARKFTLDHNLIPDKSIHLTNNAVQKNLKNYGEYEEGNQISLKDFQKYLDSIKSGIDVRNNLYSQMKQLVDLSFMSVRGKINPNNRSYQFEIFGFDFIIDINYKVWLIEVNTTPCLEESSGILRILLPRMLYDTFSLTLDKIFGGDPSNTESCPFLVEGYEPNDNLWELISELSINRKMRDKRTLTQNNITLAEKTAL